MGNRGTYDVLVVIIWAFSAKCSMRHINDRVVVEKQAGCYWRCGGIFGHPDKYIMGTYHCICLQYIVNRYEKFNVTAREHSDQNLVKCG